MASMDSSITVCGREYEFTAEPDDDLKCLICLQTAQNPLQHELCGKLFCKECLEKYGRSKPCPNCREEHSYFYKDSRSKFHLIIISLTMHVSYIVLVPTYSACLIGACVLGLIIQ